jgi:hypothetical protein
VLDEYHDVRRGKLQSSFKLPVSLSLAGPSRHC